MDRYMGGDHWFNAFGLTRAQCLLVIMQRRTMGATATRIMERSWVLVACAKAIQIGC